MWIIISHQFYVCEDKTISYSDIIINIYILGVFTEKRYSKPLERNVVCIPIITLSRATSHDFKWRQNKPWLSTVWLDVGDVMTSLTLSRC